MRTLSRLACLITLARSPDLVAPPATSAQFAAVALTAVAAGANRKHRAATWLTTLTWPKALNMTVRRAHLMNIHRPRDDRQPFAPAARDDVASRLPGNSLENYVFR
jgi:hypothetical protein